MLWRIMQWLQGNHFRWECPRCDFRVASNQPQVTLGMMDSHANLHNQEI